MAAATEEFAAKGFAGARFASIAERAGVNAQLISYYFGSKQGLHDALRDKWLAEEAVISDPALPIDQVLAGYFDASIKHPDRARLLLWQALGDAPGDEAMAAQRLEVGSALEDLRRRQRDSELSSDFEAEFILLVSWAAAAAPITLPHVIRGAYDLEPDSAEFRQRFLPQLQKLFRGRDT